MPSFCQVVNAVDIRKIGSQALMKGHVDWFTGTVRVELLSASSGWPRAAGASVAFEPGARTARRTHPLGQTLIVSSGLGRVQREGGPTGEIQTGDVVFLGRTKSVGTARRRMWR